ncbi:MAG: ABC transporter permease [Acidimicrobiia bacterium]
MTTELTPSTLEPGLPEPSTRTWARWLRERPLVVLGAVLVVLILITGVIEPSYLSVTGLRNSALFAAPLGILAAGQTILMLTAGIDLSVTMVATLAAYVVANQAPQGPFVAIVFGLLAGAVAGGANGLGVGVFRVNPLIMTLATSAILLGLLTSWAQTIFAGSTAMVPFVRTIGGGSFLGNRVPWAVVIWAVIAALIILTLRRTGFGRVLYGLGDNAVAMRLAGVRSWQVLVLAYTLSGLLAAVAGILLAGKVGNVDLSLAATFLLPSVAAAVIGGTSIFGGMGTYSGTILGALILGVLQSMLTFLNAGQAVQYVLYGSIVLGLAWVYARVIGEG